MVLCFFALQAAVGAVRSLFVGNFSANRLKLLRGHGLVGVQTARSALLNLVIAEVGRLFQLTLTCD